MARKDKIFHSEMDRSDSRHRVPGFFSDELDRILYATVYFGWLVGKGLYEGELKQYLTELDGK